ncbi:hypothetical protein ACKWTF_015052 [Chironomus riparius]
MDIKADTPDIPALTISECLYHNFTSFPRKSELYTCTIIEINGQQNEFLEHNKHMLDKSNEDVKIVRLTRTRNCTRIPKGLTQIFPNLEILIINDCKISKIDREDLKGLENLKELIVEHSPVYHLDTEVFRDLRELEVIMFHKTKLTTIEPNIFDTLKSLKAVYLIQNPSINAIYIESIDLSLPDNFDPHTKAPSINELKKIINGCSPCDSVCTDLKKLLANEEFKDFTVTIKESCYHGIDCNERCCNEVLTVHKFLLIARSPILAKMIHKNPDARNLNLIDIPRYAFKKVVDYFYNGVIPTSKSDPYLKMKDLFAVADKLGLRELRLAARNEILMQEIQDKNVGDVDLRTYEGASSSDNPKKPKIQMAKSLDHACCCERSDRIDMMGLSLCYMKQDLADKCVHYSSKKLQNQVMYSNSKLNPQKVTQLEPESDCLDIIEDFYELDGFISVNSANLNCNSDGSALKSEASSTTDLKHKIPKPLPENLNYKNANYRGSMISHMMNTSEELNDSDGHDFVKIEIEDQYEIIGDFYDEVCSVDDDCRD